MNETSKEAYEPLLITLDPRPDMTFDSLVTCKANEFPAEVAKAMAEGYYPPYNPLYIYSDVGLGKTHLLSSIAHEVQKNPDAAVAMFNAVDLEAEVQRAERLGFRAELREWLSSRDILLIDDIQLCESSEPFQKELFAIISRMTNLNKRVAITCDVPPTRLQGIEKRLISRLGGGVILSLHMAEISARIEIMKRTAADTHIGDEVLKYLAERIDDNIRRLKSAIFQLLVHHRETGVEINIELTRAIIPMPEDLQHDLTLPMDKNGPASNRDAEAHEPGGNGGRPSEADRFKEMLESAENEEEQALALQIAIGERIRQLRGKDADKRVLEKLNNALNLLREGEFQAAVEYMAGMNES